MGRVGAGRGWEVVGAGRGDHQKREVQERGRGGAGRVRAGRIQIFAPIPNSAGNMPPK